MQIAFCLYKYFPYGGMQRDFMAFLREAIARGHHCRVYCMRWQGDQPKGVDVRLLPRKGWANHTRARHFTHMVESDLAREPVDVVFGFNKMPGLDLYYAADSCYEDKARTQRGALYRWGPRYRHYSAYERAVFAAGAKAKILLISQTEKDKFIKYYATEEERLFMLPPGISRDRCAPENLAELRSTKRREMNIAETQRVLLFVGSGFIKKGLGRAIEAVAALPSGEREKTILLIVGQDREEKFRRLANERGVSNNVQFLGGRDDVPELLFMADALIHPAFDEAAGIVLLEALVAGLPVLVTDVCGYAHHIAAAGAGIVLPSPFSQSALNDAVMTISDRKRAKIFQEAALKYAESEDLYSMHATGIDQLEQHFSTSSKGRAAVS